MIWLWIWVAVVVISAVIEAFSQDMTSIWFTCGGLVALIINACGAGLIWQIIPFVVVTTLCIILLRPVAKKYINKTDTKTNVSALIGVKAELINDITELSNGEITISGVTWKVKDKDNNALKKGTIVEVVNVEGNRLIVKEAN